MLDLSLISVTFFPFLSHTLKSLTHAYSGRYAKKSAKSYKKIRVVRQLYCSVLYICAVHILCTVLYTLFNDMRSGVL